MTGDWINLVSFIRPDCEAGSSWLSMKFRLATVGDQVNFEAQLKGFVMNGHQFRFAIDSAAHLGKGTGEPRAFVGREVIQ